VRFLRGVLACRGDCDAVAGSLPAYVAGEVDLDDASAAHLAQCLRCQADVARYRRMLRTLHALRSDPAVVPPGSLSALLAGLDGQRPRREGWVALGLAAAAGALGTVGLLAWTARRRLGVAGHPGGLAATAGLTSRFGQRVVS